MRKFWLVFWQEYRNRVFNWQFVFSVLALPVLGLVAAMAVFWIMFTTTDHSPIGVIDQTGYFAPGTFQQTNEIAIPSQGGNPSTSGFSLSSMLAGGFRSYPYEAQAQADLQAGKIQAYYILPENFLTSHDIRLFYRKKQNPSMQILLEKRILAEMLRDYSPDKVRLLTGGIGIIPRILSASQSAEEQSSTPLAGTIRMFLRLTLPIIAMYIMQLTLAQCTGYLSSALVAENTNRTVEILFSSVSPDQMMIGKTLAIVAMGLTQLAVWLGAPVGMMVLFLGIPLQAGKFLPGGWAGVAWFCCLALLTMVLYSALIVVVTMLSSDVSQGQQYSFFVTIWGLLPLILYIPIFLQPNSALSLALSIFPLTSASTLLMRSGFTNVPAWQLALGWGLLALSTVGALLLAGRVFRSGMLRTGATKRIGRWSIWLRVKKTLRITDQPSMLGKGRPEPRADQRTKVQPARRKGLLIFQHEFSVIIGQGSYWVATLFVPLVAMFVYGGASLLNNQPKASANLSQFSQNMTRLEDAGLAQGYVDQIGLLRLVPATLNTNRLIAYPYESAAQQALKDKKISGYYMISAEIWKSGTVYFNMNDGNPLNAWVGGEDFEALVRYNLLEGDQEMARWVESPVHSIQMVDMSDDHDQRLASQGKGMMDSISLLAPMGMPYLLMMQIVLVSGTLLTSFEREHGNRTLELLVTSTPAYPLLMAKTCAIGLAGLLQEIVWGGSILFLSIWGGQTYHVANLSMFSVINIVWSIALAFAGFFFFSVIMVSIGVLVSGLRIYTQIAMFIQIPMFLPMILTDLFTNDPNGWLATALSLFPLTSPTAMLARLMIVRLPAWQPLLAVGILVLCGLGSLRMTAKLFRAQMLMGGGSFYLTTYLERVESWLKREKPLNLRE